jgi:hypothetical protein
MPFGTPPTTARQEMVVEPASNTLAVSIASLSSDKLQKLNDIIQKTVLPQAAEAAEAADVGGKPFGIPPLKRVAPVNIKELMAKLDMLLENLKKDTGGGGGEPLSVKFNPQENDLLITYIKEEEQKRLNAARVSGGKSPLAANVASVSAPALAVGRGSPVPRRFPRRSRKNSTFRK